MPVKGRRDTNQRSPEALRSELAARLRKRSLEIERRVFERVRDLSEPVGEDDPSYIEGMQRALTEALEYGLECIEKGRQWAAPIPPATARQARRAARNGVRLDTVLLRYAAGNKLLEEFIVAEADDIPKDVLCAILNDQGPQFDRLMEAVSSEYRHELDQAERSDAQKRADQIQRLLTGDDPESAAALDYDFKLWHVGLVIAGRNPENAARLVAERLGYRLLQTVRDQEAAWAWLGCRQQPDAARLELSLSENAPPEVSLAIGEPRRGFEGWRLTHREAQVAMQVMLRKPSRLTRGRDVVLLAAVLRDETLIRALLDSYVLPLDKGRSGPMLRETLQAYFTAGGNAAAAAEMLPVNRHTVGKRIKMVEKKLGRPLHTCQAELQIALQLEKLTGVGTAN